MSSNELFKQLGLRETPARKEVFNVFNDKGTALSHSDIEVELRDVYDRVTIYRTLTSFLEKDLIHKVLDDTGVTKYALCKEHNHGDDHHEHNHNHVHFKCAKCGVSECLNEVNIPHLELPTGYKAKEANLLVEGVCVRCN